MLALLLACASTDAPDAPTDASTAAAPKWQSDLPPETDLVPVWDGSWTLSDGTLLRQDATGLWLGDDRVATEVIGTPALDDAGATVLFTHRDDLAVVSTLVLLRAPDWTPEALTTAGSPDRGAVSPDGTQIAWVSGATGVAAVYWAPIDQAPTQLTNLDFTPGQPPSDWTPPPHAGPLRFDGPALVWESPEGPQRVALP